MIICVTAHHDLTTTHELLAPLSDPRLSDVERLLGVRGELIWRVGGIVLTCGAFVFNVPGELIWHTCGIGDHRMCMSAT